MRQGFHIIVAIALLAGTRVARGELTLSHWSSPVSGKWDEGAKWSSSPRYPDNGTPTAANTYEAVIAAPGSQYKVELKRDVELNRLTLDSAAVTLSHTAGVLQAGQIDLKAGVYEFQGGTLSHTTLNLAGGVFRPNGGAGGVLDNVTINGDAALGWHYAPRQGVTAAVLHIQNRLRVNGTLDLQSGSQLWFTGAQPLLGGTFKIASESFISTDALLTLGPTVTVIGTYAPAPVVSNQIGGIGEVVNLGTIQGGTGLRTSVRTMRNRGVMQSGSGELRIGVGSTSFMNEADGVLRGTQGTITLDGTWHNAGLISVSDTTLNLGGSFGVVDVAGLQRTGGTVNLTGTMDNSGHTFTLDATTGSWDLKGGMIKGGSVRRADGQDLGLTFYGGGLDGASAEFPIDVGNSRKLRLANGARVDQGITLGGSGATLQLDVGQVLDHMTVSAAAPSSASTLTLVEGNGTLTFGPNLLFTGGGHEIKPGTGTPELINEGRIVSNRPSLSMTISTRLTNNGLMEAVNGAVLSLKGPWTNNGIIRIGPADTLELGGSFTTAGIGTIERTGGTVKITGTLDNTSQVFSLAQVGGSAILGSGTIIGGRITAPPGASLRTEAGSTCTLQDTTLDTDLWADGALRTKARLSLNNTTLRIGSLSLLDNCLLDGQGTLVFTSANMSGAGTIGPGLVLTGPYLRVAGSIVNQGLIEVGGTAAGSFTNDVDGRLRVSNGRHFSLEGSWNNRGVISIQDSTLELGGRFSAAGMGQIDRLGNSTVRLTGVLDNTGHDLVLGDSTGPWEIKGGTISGGTVRTEGTGAATFFTKNEGGTLEGAAWLGRLSLGNGRLKVIDAPAPTGGLSVQAGTVEFPYQSPVDGWDMHFVPSEQSSTLDLTITTIFKDSRIHGGRVLIDGFHAVNEGSIIIDEGDYSSLTGEWVNRGLIRVSRGSMSLQLGLLNEPAGRIEAENTRMWVSGKVDNQGVFAVHGPTGQIVANDAYNLTVSSSGLIKASGGGSVQFSNKVTLDNYSNGVLAGGTWAAYAGSHIDLGTSRQVRRNMADLILSGEGSLISGLDALEFSGGSLTLDDGRDFTTLGSFANEGQLLLGQGCTFTASGNYTAGASSSLSLLVDLDPLQTSMLSVLGIAELSGTIEVHPSTAGFGSLGDRFQLVSAASVSGRFTTDLVPLPNGLFLELEYAPTGVYASVVPEPAAVTLTLLALSLLAGVRRKASA